MIQLTLEEAIQAAEKGIEASGIHARTEWRRKALDVVLDLCKLRSEFTSDDCWQQLAKTGWDTHEPRAMGAILRMAAAQGWCEQSGKYIPSTRPVCHRRPVPVWRSLLFRTTDMESATA